MTRFKRIRLKIRRIHVLLSAIIAATTAILFYGQACSMNPNLNAIRAMRDPYPAPIIKSIEPAVAFTGGGTTITITGENFLAGISFSIDGNTCQLTGNSSKTSASCIVPPHTPGNATVTATGFDGKSTTSTIQYDKLAFTYAALLIGDSLEQLPPNNPTADQAKTIDADSSNLSSAPPAGSTGATQFAFLDNLLYSIDVYGYKLKSFNIKTNWSTTLVGSGVPLNGTDVILNAGNPVDDFINTEKAACLAMIGTTIYFCVDDVTIASINLETKKINLLPGSYLASDPDAPSDYHPAFSQISAIYSYNDKLIVLDKSKDIVQIVNPQTGAVVTVAGDACHDPNNPNFYCVSLDGDNSISQFTQLSYGRVIGDNLYVLDTLDSGQDDNSTLIRKINLKDTKYTTTTIAGTTTLTKNAKTVDGINTNATFANISAITAVDNKLLLYEELSDRSSAKLRSFDLSTMTSSTLFTFQVTKPNIGQTYARIYPGALSNQFSTSIGSVTGIEYIENYGLVIGTNSALFRLY